ncbi:hypothetical protein HPB47_008480 [Ixodes persulcatus]|uniref:Uncharacterized protein n=1 Tax=Ixodes persulcatus TaxID=34615 RepID=A0AC60P4U5_IXOPE|nr:hypothetical protein HPB47_008480 [Ixodes persulcatus]
MSPAILRFFGDRDDDWSRPRPVSRDVIRASAYASGGSASSELTRSLERISCPNQDRDFAVGAGKPFCAKSLGSRVQLTAVYRYPLRLDGHVISVHSKQRFPLA